MILTHKPTGAPLIDEPALHTNNQLDLSSTHSPLRSMGHQLTTYLRETEVSQC
jgi:hypothetical protein